MFHNLFMLAPDSGAGTGAAGGDPAGAPAEPNSTPAGGDPAAVTPPAGSTTEDAQASLLADLGVDNLDSLKEIIKASNDAKAANQTDLENAKTDLDKANKSLGKETHRANVAEEQLAAYKQGVDETHINDALALARADMADKSKGLKTIADALAGVLTRNPAFKGEGAQKVNPDGTNAIAGENVGGATSTGKSTLTEQIAQLNANRITH